MPQVSKENKKLHKIWRTAVLEKDKHCQICGPTPYGASPVSGKPKKRVLNAHHLLPKEFNDFRWLLDNGMILCVPHHTFGKFSAHKNPVWFTLWLAKNKPDVYWTTMKRVTNV